MKNLIRKVSVLAFTVLSVLSCEKVSTDYDGPKDVTKEEFVIVTSKTLKDFSLLTDNGATLNVTTYDDVDIEQIKSGDRLLAKYKTLSTAGSNSYNVSLLNYSKVRLNNIVYSSKLSDKEIEDLGKERINNVKTTITGGKYLNLDYQIYYLAPGYARSINIFVNEGESTKDCLILELKHNSFDNEGMMSEINRMSFSVEELLPEGVNSVNFKLRWHAYKGTKPEERTGKIVRNSKNVDVIYSIAN